jgi:hypothetical protein
MGIVIPPISGWSRYIDKSLKFSFNVVDPSSLVVAEFEANIREEEDDSQYDNYPDSRVSHVELGHPAHLPGNVGYPISTISSNQLAALRFG